MLQGKGKQNPSAPTEVWPSHSGTSSEREEIQTPGKLTRKGGKGKREPKAGELLQRLSPLQDLCRTMWRMNGWICDAACPWP